MKCFLGLQCSTVFTLGLDLPQVSLLIAPKLRLLFVLATEHTLLRMFLNIWRQILSPGDLLFRISVQLNVEPLIAHVVCNSQHA